MGCRLCHLNVKVMALPISVAIKCSVLLASHLCQRSAFTSETYNRSLTPEPAYSYRSTVLIESDW